MTLDFADLTATNVVQNVAESFNNEKRIEFGDYDNDGDQDIVIAVAIGAFGQRRNKLYRNDDGVMVEVSGAPVISGFSSTDVSRNAFFRDFDLDGFLDIIVVNDSNAGDGSNNSPGKTKYFRNVNGTMFVNESERLSNQTGAACGGAAADFDQNGYCDLLMCNYPFSSQDSLGLNNINGSGAGQFTVVTNTHFAAESNYGVNSEVADMNGDGKIDVLTGNLSDPDFIYYNDNNGAGSGVGDFRYAGAGAATSFTPAGALGYQSLVPADFNGDGMMDFYYSNMNSSRADAIYINTGNDSDNKAVFNVQLMPSSVNGETTKVACPDLDGDGRPDLVVMSEDRRPYIFRNTSSNGAVNFIEWTPPVISNVHEGWHADAVDLVGDSKKDLFIGAQNDDFLLENRNSLTFDTNSFMGGALPTFHGLYPIAVTGRVAGGEIEQVTSLDVPTGGNVSILLRSTDDLRLEVSGSNDEVSDQKGKNVDEFLNFVAGGGAMIVQIINESAPKFLGDANGDGTLDLLDVAPFVGLVVGGEFNPVADFNGDGDVSLLDVAGFVAELSSGGKPQLLETDFVIEFTSR